MFQLLNQNWRRVVRTLYNGKYNFVSCVSGHIYYYLAYKPIVMFGSSVAQSLERSRFTSEIVSAIPFQNTRVWKESVNALLGIPVSALRES